MSTSAQYKTFIPTYLPIPLSSTLEFYGDSITYGTTLPSPTTQRWSYLLSSYLGKTEDNHGVGGNEWCDLSNSSFNPSSNPSNPGAGWGDVFGNHTVGNTTFLAIGVNDIAYQNQIYNDMIMRVMDVYSLWSCMPSVKGTSTAIGSGNKVFDCRNTNAFSYSGGTGIPTVCSIGVYINTVGAYIQSNAGVLNGRYVFGCFLQQQSDTNTWQLTIDGTVVQQNIPCQNYLNTTTLAGTNWNPVLFFYDTQSAVNTPHIVNVSVQSGSNSVPFLYIGCFNGDGSDSVNSVFVVPPTEVPDYFSNQTPVTNNYTNLVTYRYYYEKRCNYWRKRYNLPIYFCDVQIPSIYGSCSPDVHPNISGHNDMFMQILDTIQNGEFNMTT